MIDMYMQAALANLTLEFNQTELLSAERLQELRDSLRFLQDMADQNQVRIDMLTEEVCYVFMRKVYLMRHSYI